MSNIPQWASIGLLDGSVERLDNGGSWVYRQRYGTNVFEIPKIYVPEIVAPSPVVRITPVSTPVQEAVQASTPPAPSQIAGVPSKPAPVKLPPSVASPIVPRVSVPAYNRPVPTYSGKC